MQCKHIFELWIIGEIVVKMLRRWTHTYLMPNVALYTSMTSRFLASFGDDTPVAKKSLDFLIEKCMVNIFDWMEERKLGEATCQLLSSLTSITSIRCHLPECPSYQRMISRYQDGSLPCPKLPLYILRQFVQVLCQSQVSGKENQKRRWNSFVLLYKLSCNVLFLSIGIIFQFFLFFFFFFFKKYIHETFQSFNGSTMIRNSNKIHRLEISLYMIHGVVLSNVEPAFGWTSQYSQTLINVISLFTTEPNTHIAEVFRIFADLTELYLPFLPNPKGFLSVCVKVIKEFGRLNEERSEQLRNSYIDKTIKKRFEEMQVEEIHEVLRLLKHMSTEDLAGNEDILSLSGESLLLGLNYLIPHLNSTLLAYPQLCEEFFDVLSIGLSTFISKFASMSRQHQTVLVECIPFALDNADSRIIAHALQIIECMATYHFTHS
ncbi:hypothetical protein RFI_12163 [Reticulomyxa filosa]|uniref:Uncharacterized protein n=1 Tax=Reticulomyxa filosa TaxID=46433 RepID=X6NI13_RETFI|nr:hypothetical protein RFI_12163 [Reticulomyxa filosa]|eukprot:ETO24982.1 hypothetical protein RFI_12163 [Reticulomyxa filosa]